MKSTEHMRDIKLIILKTNINTKLLRKIKGFNDQGTRTVNSDINKLNSRIRSIKKDLNIKQKYEDAFEWVNTDKFSLHISLMSYRFVLNLTDDIDASAEIKEKIKSISPDMGTHLFDLINSKIKNKHKFHSKVNFDIRTSNFHSYCSAPMSYNQVIDKMLEGVFSMEKL
jgi:hypothetical protein